MQKRVKDIIQKLANENGLSFAETHEIVAAPWRYMQKTLLKIQQQPPVENVEELPIFFHQNLGRFIVSEKKFNKLKERKDGKTHS
jgi:hypothetical protein